MDPSDLIVNAVGGCRSDALDYLRERGVVVQDVGQFDERSPHCNKISGALALAATGIEGLALLTDTDIVILEDPRALAIGDRSVASKPVDRELPSLTALTKVFTAAGLPLPSLWPIDAEPGKSTLAGNGNGGFYLVPAGVLPVVAAAWERWARWLLERMDLLGRWTVNLDQVAMAMAIASEGCDAQRLDSRWNFPTHDRRYLPPSPIPPAVIHYHKEVNARGLILRTGVPAVDRQIDLANSAIGEIWHDAFPNATFWDWRYATDPALGSGVGSRGKPLADKRQLLSALIDVLHPASVLDVGCGDGEATKGLPLPHYVGIDLSREAVRLARSGRPDGDYRVGALTDQLVEAELTLCLDVLIHESDASRYRATVKALLESATKALLISGYEQVPATDSEMVHFHEALSATLTEFAPEAELYPLREVHGISTFLVLRVPPDAHPRDYRSATLALVAKKHPNPLRLVSLRTSAWETTGFFPDHAPRLWEYPAICDLIMNLVRAGGRVVDIGAGVNPLVPYLAAHGYEVDTVDPSGRVRTLPATPDWTEWGFLDYAAVGMAHRSWNCPLNELPVGVRFDAAYCISVIEHLPAADRRRLLRELADRVRPGGVVILTVDLVRSKDDLWNRSEGHTVEPEGHHGTLPDLVEEAEHAGFVTSDVQTVRDWGDVPVDIGLVVLGRGTRPIAADRKSVRLASTGSRLGGVVRKSARFLRRRARL
ncbi:MAG: class I SAM-dependent methyltransferase [Acidimicrobiales bacterium]